MKTEQEVRERLGLLIKDREFTRNRLDSPGIIGRSEEVDLEMDEENLLGAIEFAKWVLGDSQ